MANYLKRQQSNIHITLVDPSGSGLYHKVRHGVFYSPYEAEGTRRRHQVDTVVEGVGINRLTRNFAMALPSTQRAAFRDILSKQQVTTAATTNDDNDEGKPASTSWNAMASEKGWIDDAMRVTDAEAVAMSRYLVDHEGGPSSKHLRWIEI